MMKALSKAVLPALGLLTLATTGCKKDSLDPDTITEQSLSECFVVVKDLNDPTAVQTVTSVNVKYYLNWTQAKCDAIISGLNVFGTTLPAITLSDMKWTMDNKGWCEVEASRPTQSAGSIANPPVVTDFEMDWLFRMELIEAANTYDPVGYFECDIDNRYHLVGARQPTFMGGITECSCAQLPTYSYDDAVYSIILDFKTMKATMSITGAKFNEHMPALDMQFAGIDFTYGEKQGSFVLSCDALTPSIGGSPMAGFPISNLKAEVYPGHQTEIYFECTPETMPMSFQVRASVTGADYQAIL
ncbi:MAG: hypothetical protein K2M19_01805 [Muribaculaceae bacterium]|nr:hypothetical protein [Muribaculaceae bacterium]